MSIELKTKKNQTKLNNLSLRPLIKTDCENVCRWMQSLYILQYSFVVSGKKTLPKDFSTSDYTLRYFDMLLSNDKRETFAIIFNNIHIGNIGLKEIDKKKLSAECFIEIGEANYRNRGLGTKAMKQILDLAFFEYNLEEILLDVLEFNLRAIMVYDRLGFIVIGFNGWHYDEYGQYWKVLRMKLKKEQWQSYN